MIFAANGYERQQTNKLSDDFKNTIKPRDLTYKIEEYWAAISDTNNPSPYSLGYQWSDKPHRLVYDLCSKIRFDNIRTLALVEEIECLKQAHRRIVHECTIRRRSPERDAQTVDDIKHIAYITLQDCILPLPGEEN